MEAKAPQIHDSQRPKARFWAFGLEVALPGTAVN